MSIYWTALIPPLHIIHHVVYMQASQPATASSRCCHCHRGRISYACPCVPLSPIGRHHARHNSFLLFSPAMPVFVLNPMRSRVSCRCNCCSEYRGETGSASHCAHFAPPPLSVHLRRVRLDEDIELPLRIAVSRCRGVGALGVEVDLLADLHLAPFSWPACVDLMTTYTLLYVSYRSQLTGIHPFSNDC